jgi:hypothetical protein
MAVLLWRGCDKNSQITGLAKDKQFLEYSFTTTGQSNAALLGNYQLEVQRLNGQNQEESNKILQLTQERDKAQLEAQSSKNDLACWMMLAYSQSTNTPLTVRMDALLAEVATVASHTNTDSEVVNLELVVNDSPIPLATKKAVISLQQSRTIQYRVLNKGSLPAKGIAIDLFIPLDLTNLTFAGWQPQALKVNAITMQEVKGLNHLRVRAEDLIANGSSFITPPISISTNVASPMLSLQEMEAIGWSLNNQFTNALPNSRFPFLPTEVLVYSEQSSTRQFLIFFYY